MLLAGIGSFSVTQAAAKNLVKLHSVFRLQCSQASSRKDFFLEAINKFVEIRDKKSILGALWIPQEILTSSLKVSYVSLRVQ